MHIICFGNDLHGDDGFGLRVFEQLSKLSWPEHVQVFNAGIAGLNAMRFFEHCREVILVDALRNFTKVGKVSLLSANEIMAQQANNAHALGIAYLLQAVQVMLNPLPEIRIVGVEIPAISVFRYGLSAEVEQAIPETVAVIRGLCAA